MLKQLKEQQLRQRYNRTPDEWTKFAHQAKFSDKNEKELERCIIEYGKIEGFQAERDKVKPNRIDNRIKYVDSVGFVKQIGRITWTKSSMQAGSADLSLTIRGRSVKVEIKIGKDTQKKAQKEYQRQIEAAGGQYWIIKTFQEFYDRYQEFINTTAF